MGRLGSQSAKDEVDAPAPSGGATVGSASRLIEDAQAEYAELVRDGDAAATAGEGELTRRWQPLDLALLGVPALLVLVGLLV